MASKSNNTAATLVGLYNKYLIDLILHAKARDATSGGGLRRVLREAGHKAIDPASSAYVHRAAKSLREDDSNSNSNSMRKAFVEDVETLDVLTDERVSSFEPLEGIALRAISLACGGREDHDARTYVYILVVLAATYLEVVDVDADADDEGDAESPLVGSVISVLSRAMTAPASGDEEENAQQLVVDGILEDDIAILLERVAAASSFAANAAAKAAAAAEATAAAAAAADGPAPSTQPLEDLLKSLKNSKIADMATEISKEIDLSGTEDPMELLSFDKLTDSTSVIGSIVLKVGSKIQSKLASGELKHDELISEAVGFLKAFEGGTGGGGAGGANPLAGLMSALGGAMSGGGAGGGENGNLMADVMKMAQSMGMGMGGGSAASSARGNGRSSLVERRDRLRAKAAAKKGE
jgi:hypothetical protein